MSTDPIRPRGPWHPEDDAVFRTRRRDRRLRHEVVGRAAVWVLILAFMG